jgi:hypothetical protein
MTKIYKYRKLPGLESRWPRWAQLGDSRGPALSQMLDAMGSDDDRLFVCGKLEEMTREWMCEPLTHGWKLEKEFVFKHRTAVYEREGDDAHICGVDNCGDRKVSVKLIGHRESWFPGCEDATVAVDAWRALREEWKSTGLPLLSTPRATGIALLWESLPRGVEFPALPDDLAKLIRANSPQHRIEWVADSAPDDECEKILLSNCVQYDGRWMYASLCGLDRFPVGEPKRAEGFTPYVPGIYDVTIRIPSTWNHVGLIPTLDDGFNSLRAWVYPSEPGRTFRTWAFEPELTLALKRGWEIFDFHDGYKFEKGRPLATWARRLIEMRRKLQESAAVLYPYPASVINGFAAAAIRQILNHSIGALHKGEHQREEFVSDLRWREWRKRNPHLAEGEDVVRVEGGYMVPTFVADTSPLSIFMPHWSSTLYSRARARVAEWALLCEPETLVKIHGDALYSTVAQPELDRLDDGKTPGRPRRKCDG